MRLLDAGLGGLRLLLRLGDSGGVPWTSELEVVMAVLVVTLVMGTLTLAWM